MRALSLRDPFEPMLVALPMLSRFLDAAASFGGAFSASVGTDGRGAADARRGGAGEGDSPNVIRDKECREDVGLCGAGVSSEPAAGCFFAELSIIVAIVARSEASSVEALMAMEASAVTAAVAVAAVLVATREKLRQQGRE